MKLCLLASGSKGNSVYIETGETRILVDAGCSGREICNRLDSKGIDPSTLDAILLTHEHTDHLNSVGTLSKRLNIPALLSHHTFSAVRKMADRKKQFSKLSPIQFEAGSLFTFRDLAIDPFPITHDAEDPVGFVIESREGKIGIATDLGIATRLVKEKLKGCRALVLESNHDEEMLRNGPYPPYLQQRIRSRHGHLSNAESVELLQDVIHGGLEGLFLAHLSEVNNHPHKAMTATSSFLDSQNISRPRLIVGSQDCPTETLVI